MPEPIAIVAVAGRFPGCGADLDLFWANVADAATAPARCPADRWRLPPRRACRPVGPRTPIPSTHARGYYLDPFEPDLTGLAIDPDLVGELDPLFHLVLDVGDRAWRGRRSMASTNARSASILGNICLPTDASNDLCREILAAVSRTPRVGPASAARRTP